MGSHWRAKQCWHVYNWSQPFFHTYILQKSEPSLSWYTLAHGSSPPEKVWDDSNGPTYPSLRGERHGSCYKLGKKRCIFNILALSFGFFHIKHFWFVFSLTIFTQVCTIFILTDYASNWKKIIYKEDYSYQIWSRSPLSGWFISCHNHNPWDDSIAYSGKYCSDLSHS